jgi:hypothetical protein
MTHAELIEILFKLNIKMIQSKRLALLEEIQTKITEAFIRGQQYERKGHE